MVAVSTIHINDANLVTPTNKVGTEHVDVILDTTHAEMKKVTNHSKE